MLLDPLMLAGWEIHRLLFLRWAFALFLLIRLMLLCGAACPVLSVSGCQCRSVSMALMDGFGDSSVFNRIVKLSWDLGGGRVRGSLVYIWTVSSAFCRIQAGKEKQLEG